MGFDSCSDCGYVFSKVGNDIPYADGGFLEVNHGGGVCRKCYLLDRTKIECVCGVIIYSSWIFCPHCGNKRS